MGTEVTVEEWGSVRQTAKCLSSLEESKDKQDVGAWGIR